MSSRADIVNRLRNFSFHDLPVRVVGVVTLIALLVGVVGAFAVGSLRILDDTYDVRVVLPETGGLRTGDRVRVAGIEVGRVASLSADFDEGLVVATLAIDSGVDLGSDTTAEISLATLLGGRYVRLAGPVVEPYLEDLETAQRTIPIERTRLPLGVIDALGQLTGTAEAIDADAVDQLLRDAAAVAEGAAPSADGLFADVEQLAALLNARRGQIDELLDDTIQVTDALAQRDRAIGRLIDSAEVLLAEIARRQDQVRAVLGDGSEAVRTLDALVARNRDELDSILGTLDDTLDVVGDRQSELAGVLATASPTVGSFAEAGRSGPWVDVILSGLSVIQLRNILLEQL